MIFHEINIDIYSVLNAARTKWNFLDFKPGLVGGHCIGVDPYYLTYKAELSNLFPEIVLSGRRVNESVPAWLVQQLTYELATQKKSICDSHILILGYSFKENCPDTRNTKVYDLCIELRKLGALIDIYDPIINIEASLPVTLFNFIEHKSDFKSYDVIILATPHHQFLQSKFISNLQSYLAYNGIIFDFKGMLPKETKNLFRI